MFWLIVLDFTALSLTVHNAVGGEGLRQSARDADRVGIFLGALGLGATPNEPRPMPAGFLLHLGAALRLLMWETKGFFFHRDAGLPDARQAIRDAFNSLNSPDADPTELCMAILRYL